MGTPPFPPPLLPSKTAEQQEAKEAERERVAKKIEVLMDEQFALSQQFERSLGMRQVNN